MQKLRFQVMGFSLPVCMLRLSDTWWRHPPSTAQSVFLPLTSSSWLWTCWTIRSMATIFPPPGGGRTMKPTVRGVYCWVLGIYEKWGRLFSPLGTTMSASLMVGSMYCSKAGFTNLLYCLMTPSMSRPRSVMSLRSRRTSRMSESVSTKIFISRSCRWEEQEQHSLKDWAPHKDLFKQKPGRLTWRSSLSAKDIIPSNIITLAP